MKRGLACACAVVLTTSCALLPFSQAAPPAGPATTTTSVAGENPAPATVVEGRLLAPAGLGTGAEYRVAGLNLAAVPGGLVVPVPPRFCESITARFDHLQSIRQTVAKRELAVAELGSRLTVLADALEAYDEVDDRLGGSHFVYEVTAAELPGYLGDLPGRVKTLVSLSSGDEVLALKHGAVNANFAGAEKAKALAGGVANLHTQARKLSDLLSKAGNPPSDAKLFKSYKASVNTARTAISGKFPSLRKSRVSSFVEELKAERDRQKEQEDKYAARATNFKNLVLAGFALVASATADRSGAYKLAIDSSPVAASVVGYEVINVFGVASQAADSGTVLSGVEAASAYWSNFKADAPVKAKFAKALQSQKPYTIAGQWKVPAASGYRIASEVQEALQFAFADGARAADITPGTTVAVSALRDSLVRDMGAFEEIARKLDALMSDSEARMAATGNLGNVSRTLLEKSSDLHGLVGKLIASSPVNPEPNPDATPTPLPGPTPAPAADFVYVLTEDTTLHLSGTGSGEELRPSATALSAEVRMTDDATHSAVTWQTSDSEVATVDGSGRVSAGTKAGSAIITAVSSDGKASGSIEIVVQSGGLVEVEVQ